MTDDENNIDELVDYKEDFESDNNSNLQQDSFNKDIQKLYEDHKKSISKPTEMQNLNRPISSYHRQNGKREEIDCKSENAEINPENLLSRLNSYIEKNKIKKTDLLDNSAIYLDLDDFKELFKRIRFEISANELNCLFKFRNNSFEEGYLYGKHFLENFNLADLLKNEKAFEKPVYDSSPIINKENIEENVKKQQQQKLLKEKIDFNEINNQLKLIQNEVNNIVKKDKSVGNKKIISAKKASFNPFDKSRKFSARNISSRNDISSSNTSEVKVTNFLNNNINNQNTRLIHPILPGINSLSNLRPKSSAATKRVQSGKSYLKETIKKQNLEKELIRLNLEKKNKENEREYVRKMTEANQLCLKLNIAKSFSALTDEIEGLKCQVLDKISNKTTEIDLAIFNFEWKKLKKLDLQREHQKYYTSNLKPKEPEPVKKKKPIGFVEEINKNKEFLEKNRKEKQEDIKKTLIESIKLKLKLKKQLKALRDKKIMCESIIKANLRLTNLDDDTIF